MTTKSGKAKTGSASRASKAALKRPAKAASKGHASPKAVEKKSAAPVKPAKVVPSKTAPAKPAAVKRPASKALAIKPAVAKKATKAAPKRSGRQREFDDLRKVLIERQRELVRAYTMSKGDSRSHPDSGTEDYIDYAVSSYAKEFVLSLSEMDRKQLVMVEEALRRIERGEYGRCQQCGEEVARKRLEVAPWVRYCVRCQGLEEQGLLPQYPSRLDADDRDEEGGEEASPLEYEGDAAAEDEEEIDEEPLVVDDEADDLDED